MRGLAALSVVAHHCFIMLPAFYSDTAQLGGGASIVRALKHTPLHILWAGHEAVMLFFVLSGFVLSLPTLSGRTTPYRTYLAKRFTRIYAPCVVAVLVGLALRELCVTPHVYGGSPLLDPLWRAPITPRLFLGCTLLAGTFNLTSFNSVLWSLVHELRISILLPVLAVFVWRRHWGIAVAATVALYGLARVYLMSVPYNADSLAFTASYVPMFLVGAVLAKHRTELRVWYNSLGKIGRLCLAAAAVLCYTYAYTGFLGIGHRYVDEPMATAGAAAFIVIALASGRVSAVLRAHPLVFLGRMSYSLYLYHFTVILTAVHLLNGRLPLPTIMGLAAALCLPVAAFAYYAVEVPSIRWAKRMSRASAPKEAGQTTYTLVRDTRVGSGAPGG